MSGQIGRIVVNHEKLPRDDGEGEQGEGNTWRGTLQLTSQIEMGQSMLSLDTQCGSSEGHTPTSRTLQGSISMPASRVSRCSPSTVCPSDSSQRWLKDSIRRLSSTNVCTSEGDASQTENCSQDAGSEERVHSPSSSSSSHPSPRPLSSELPPSEVSS